MVTEKIKQRVCVFKLTNHTIGDLLVYKCQHGTTVEVDSIPNNMKELQRWGQIRCDWKKYKEHTKNIQAIWNVSKNWGRRIDIKNSEQPKYNALCKIPSLE